MRAVDGVICWQAAVKSLHVHFRLKGQFVKDDLNNVHKMY